MNMRMADIASTSSQLPLPASRLEIAAVRGLQKIVMLWLVAALNAVVPGPMAAAADDLADLRSVLGELRQGGFVLYFRHGLTDKNGPGDEVADLSKCETQRNLSAAGRAQVVHIGEALRTLRIPVGTVTTSPFCRCKDTAKLAFGRFTVSNDLYFAIGASAEETKKLTQSLRRMLSTPPAPAANAVVVSHSANLREATGIWPKQEGVAYVFRPLPEGKFAPVAMILPDDWAKLAALEVSNKPR